MITIKKYQELYNAIKLGGNDEIRTAYNVMSVLTGKPIHEYRKMKWVDFLKEQEGLSIPDISSFPDAWVTQFECQGETFFVQQYITDWNTEQFISMSSLTKEKEAIVDNLHLILATLCYKEKDEDVQMTEFNRRAEMFREYLDVDVAYPIGFFFALLSVKLSEHTQSSSTKKRKSRKKKTKRIGLVQSGRGMLQSISSLLRRIGLNSRSTLK
jgi:hypothetical protein